MQSLILAFKNLPVPRKINFAILLTCGSALAATAAAIFVVQLITFRHSFDRDLKTTGRMIGQTTTAAVSAKPHILRASLDLPDGSDFAAFKSEELGLVPPPPADSAHSVGPYENL